LFGISTQPAEKFAKHYILQSTEIGNSKRKYSNSFENICSGIINCPANRDALTIMCSGEQSIQ